MKPLNQVRMDAFSLSWGHAVIGETVDLRRTLDGIGSAKGSVMG